MAHEDGNPTEIGAAAIERARNRTSEFRKVADDLCAAFEAREKELLAKLASLDAAIDLTRRDTVGLIEREKRVARREQEVANIRKIAADRKVQVETANQIADAADVSRRKAEIGQRMAETEKLRLEEAVATLIREKRELSTKKIRLEQELAACLSNKTATSLKQAAE